MKIETSSGYLKAAQLGLIAGIVAMLICLVGMVQEFNEKDIIAGVITLGQTVIVVVFLMAGYSASGKLTQSRLGQTLAGALAGFLTAGVLAVMVIVIDLYPDIRDIFLNASPQLVEILTLGKGLNPGLFYLIGIGALVGAFGGFLHSLPGLVRRAVTMGIVWVVLLGLLEPLLQGMLNGFPSVQEALTWMFGKGMEEGLSVTGAVLVFMIVTGSTYLWGSRGKAVNARVQNLPKNQRKTLRWVSLAMLAVLLIYLPVVVGLYFSEVINQVGLFIMMALGLNIVVGFAGLLDLGYVAFYAIGAYTIAVLTNTSGELAWNFQWTFWQALPVALFVATMAGIMLGIPVLGIRGDYLAIVTLGFGEIIRILVLSDWLKPYLGGSQGITRIPPIAISIGPWEAVLNTPQTLYYFILVGILALFFIATRLRDSRLGRSWKALREDEDVAEAMGINLVVTKLLAFATGAAFAGMAGAVLAPKLGTIYPHSFALLISINVLAVIIIGGMGSIPGVFIGSLLLVGLPELLREFAEYRLWIYGALLVVMMQTRPEGFLPEATRKRELHEENLMEAVE